MSMTPTTATIPAVRALLKSAGKRGMKLSDVTRHFGCSTNTAGMVLRKLVAAELVVAKGDGYKRYIDKAIWEEPEAPPTPAFKWNAWTKPMRGYDARMQAAMRMRSA